VTLAPIDASRLPDLPGTYWGLVANASRDHPDRKVLADDYGRSLTSRELHDAAIRTAAALHGLGVQPGQVASWQLPTSLEAMVVMVALTRLGAVQNPIIPILRDREVRFIVAQSRSLFLIVPESWRGFPHGDLARRLGAELGLGVVVVDHETDPQTLGGRLRLPAGDPTSLPSEPTPDERAVRWLYYSSGTTADPKGVRHTDRSVMAGSFGVIGMVGAASEDVNPLAFPISHIGGSAMLAASLLSGMQLALFDSFDPETGPARIAAHRPTLLGSATPFYRAFIDAQRRQGSTRLFPRLRACLGGGAPITADLNREVREVLGTNGIANSWGLTEFPVATSPAPSAPPDILDHTVGLPVPGVEVRVVGLDGTLCGPGEEGELRLKGPQCFQGYINASLDADAYDDDGWFRTGDLGLVGSDGNVRVTGRLKDAIIRNAENVSAQEVEEVLVTHPEIVDVAVIGLPDDRTGERVCAVVVAAVGTHPTLESLVDHCRRAGLARYKHPERIEVVDVLPRNDSGKVLKRDLRAAYG